MVINYDVEAHVQYVNHIIYDHVVSHTMSDMMIYDQIYLLPDRSYDQ